MSTSAVAEQCRALNISNIEIRDGLGALVTPVINNPGEFCFYNCGLSTHCDDGDECNGQEYCLAGFCLSGGGGCDDGDPCNGVETCDGMECVAGTPPCSDDGDPCTDDCDGGDCIQSCNAAGPWDECCETSAVCAATSVCSQKAVVSVGDGSGDPGSTNNLVAVSLRNLNPVQSVSVDRTRFYITNYLSNHRPHL